MKCLRQNVESAVPGVETLGTFGEGYRSVLRDVFPEKSIPSGISFRARACLAHPRTKEEPFRESSCCTCNCTSHPASLTSYS